MKDRSSTMALVLAWLVPGLGHLYLGWRRRALLYFAVIVFMFAFGLALEGSLSQPKPGSILAWLATFADLGNGALYGLARMTGFGAGRVASGTHEYGNTFHWSAGVLNMLLVLDAYDIAQGRKVKRSDA
jgi:hypothetical protein